MNCTTSGILLDDHAIIILFNKLWVRDGADANVVVIWIGPCVTRGSQDYSVQIQEKGDISNTYALSNPLQQWTHTHTERETNTTRNKEVIFISTQLTGKEGYLLEMNTLPQRALQKLKDDTVNSTDVTNCSHFACASDIIIGFGRGFRQSTQYSRNAPIFLHINIESHIYT